MAKKKDLGRYRSGLEKYCAEQLESHGIEYDYEPKYEMVQGFKYPSTFYKSVPKKDLMVDRTHTAQKSLSPTNPTSCCPQKVFSLRPKVSLDEMTRSHCVGSFL